jgi:TorA maturation chaperone TorD
MELFRALGALAEPPAAEHARLAALLRLPAVPTSAEFTELFVMQLPPYASIYLSEDGMLGGDARDRVAGFWRALGLAPPSEPDHLTALLGLQASIAERESTATVEDQAVRARHARHALFWEHIACWLPPYLLRAREVAAPAYAAWADLLLGALDAEARMLGAPASTPLHLRVLDDMAGAADVSFDEFTGLALSPARTGAILARADFARAARELGLGLRAGDRRFVLRALLEQDAGGVLDWLRRELLRQAAALRTAPRALAPANGWWAARAEASAGALAQGGWLRGA